RLTTDQLAAAYAESDRQPPVYDPATYSVAMPESFKKSYRAWMDAEWWRLQVPEELGGQKSPSSLVWATAEFVLGANAPIWMFACGPAFARIVFENGNQRDQLIARHMVERQWGRSEEHTSELQSRFDLVCRL